MCNQPLTVCEHDYLLYATTPCAECSLDLDQTAKLAVELAEKIEQQAAEIQRLRNLMALNRAYPGQV